MLLGLCGAADLRNPGGSRTCTKVNIWGRPFWVPNGFTVKYRRTPVYEKHTGIEDQKSTTIIKISTRPAYHGVW